MKQILPYILFILSFNQLFADIAPNPIFVNGIYTVNDCKIQMTSEYVFADLYNDSAKVECTFNLKNFGDATEIQIGFPEMNFHYWSISEFTPTDKGNFKIYVDGELLTENDIQVPSEMDSIYRKYMSVYYFDNEYQRKRDSIYSAYGVKEKGNRTMYPPGTYEQAEKALQELFEWRDSKPRLGSELWSEFNDQKEKGNFPWYVWNVKFNKQERKQIKVVYSLPSGLGYGSDYRYFKYILETGSGWYKMIEKADIALQLHDINIETIEEISPNNYSIDTTQKTITWTFTNLEPTSKDDIYVRYFNIKERQQWEKYKRKRERARKWRFLNPRNWFR
jgi:hypothetical protein